LGGDWSRVANVGYLNYRAGSSDRAKLSFTGREVAWVVPKGYNRGKTAVYVDGAKATSLSLYYSTGQPREVVFRKEWPPRVAI